jgi:UDP-N-acetylmuramoyl-tripeptide--D-alanyl-D-alanine ligase
MIVLSSEEAGRALGIGPLKTAVRGVGTDTRSLRPGDLFVALRGDRFDGHDYVEAALEAGACGAVVERTAWAARSEPSQQRLEWEAERHVYPVDDTLKALGALAREVRRKSGALVLAVTGSAGKTSTKDILAAMAARVSRVAVTAANQNNEIGVPLTRARYADSDRRDGDARSRPDRRTCRRCRTGCRAYHERVSSSP